MPRLRTTTDTITDVSHARSSVGPVRVLTSDQVRTAQLVVASLVADDPRDAATSADPATRTRLRELLRALGIFNSEARMDEVRARPAIGTVRPPGPGTRGFRAPGPREANGRLSRAAKLRGEIT